MATNKNGRTAAAALQYSKWMSKFICWIWAIYRFGVLAAATYNPTAAEALASTLINLDWIMLVNEGTYLINSLGEKYIFSDRFILDLLFICNQLHSIRINEIFDKCKNS